LNAALRAKDEEMRLAQAQFNSKLAAEKAGSKHYADQLKTDLESAKAQLEFLRKSTASASSAKSVLEAERKALSDEDAEDVTFMLSQKLYRSAADAVLGLEHVPERVLHSIVEEHVRRTAIGAFSWKRGRYHLSLEGRATKEPVFADVHVGDIIVHAIILTESDEALRKAAPDDARFAPVGDAVYGLEHLKLSLAEARVVIAMDGTKTIGDLLTIFDSMPERTVRGLAAGLFCLHLTRLAGRGAAAARKISFF